MFQIDTKNISPFDDGGSDGSSTPSDNQPESTDWTDTESEEGDENSGFDPKEN